VLKDLLEIDTVEKAIAVIEKHGIPTINVTIEPIDELSEIGQQLQPIFVILEEAIENFTSQNNT
jgi:hypothetical protein